MAPLADCLGSVLAAIVITDQKEIKNSAVSAIAFGVTGTSTADLREEICVAAPDAAGAQTFAAGFTKAVGSGLDYVSYLPWSKELADPQTAVLGGAAHVVRLSAKPAPGQRADLVFQLVQQDDFETLLGLPEVLRKPGAPDSSITVSPTEAAYTPSDASPSDTPTDAGSDSPSPSSS